MSHCIKFWLSSYSCIVTFVPLVTLSAVWKILIYLIEIRVRSMQLIFSQRNSSDIWCGPLWVLKRVKEKYVQLLVHMSADLARQVGMMLKDSQNGIAGKVNIDSLFSILWNAISILLHLLVWRKHYIQKYYVWFSVFLFSAPNVRVINGWGEVGLCLMFKSC